MSEASDMVRDALAGVADLGSMIDTGLGVGERGPEHDFWVTIGGVEYFITMTQSLAYQKQAQGLQQ